MKNVGWVPTKIIPKAEEQKGEKNRRREYKGAEGGKNSVVPCILSSVAFLMIMTMMMMMMMMVMVMVMLLLMMMMVIYDEV